MATDGRKSIAILPLRPIDQSNRNGHYEIGIADSLINQLSAGRGIVVRQLSATRKYAEIEQDPLAAGRDLRVDYVVASNYQLAGGKIQITSQLITVESGQIEVYTTEKNAENLFAMQAAIANDLGNRLLSRLGSLEVDFQPKRGTDNQEAYGFYLLAANLGEERGVQKVQKALEYLDLALALDPNYAAAWAAKAHALRDIAAHPGSNQHVQYRSSMEALTKALDLDPNLSDAHSALCQNKNRYEYDAVGAETACKRAVQLDPNSPLAHKTYSNFLYSRGLFDEAIAEIKVAMELQPVSYRNQQIYGLALYYAERYEDAEAQFKRLIELSPNHTHIHTRLIMILEQQGKESEAFDYLIKMLVILKDGKKLERIRAAYQASGWRGVLIEQIKSAEAEGQPPFFDLARLNAKIGEKDKAFEYLEKAYQERSHMIAVLQVEPQLKSLHDDVRFTDLVRRVESNGSGR